MVLQEGETQGQKKHSKSQQKFGTNRSTEHKSTCVKHVTTCGKISKRIITCVKHVNTCGKMSKSIITCAKHVTIYATVSREVAMVHGF